MKWDVKPQEGVGDITFEMKAEEVRKLLGKPDFSGKQNTYSRGIMDAFSDKGIVVHYDQEETVALVEFSGPEVPEYEGTNLLEIEDPGKWIEESDKDAFEEPPDFISNKLGISFYKPAVGLHSVGVFQEGYYDEILGA